VTAPIAERAAGSGLSAYRCRATWKGSLGAGLLVVGALLFGRGLWIGVKAQLAQALLERAWARTLAGGKEVKPWPWADTWPVARLRVPKTGDDVIVLASASGRTMAFGPGHFDGTAEPGEVGNCVLSGHRDTHFAFLRKLSPGDPILLDTADGATHRYRVREDRVIEKHETWIVHAAGVRRLLTLVTCYPFDALVPGGPLRYAVVAEAAP
jgi:sortase A